MYVHIIISERDSSLSPHLSLMSVFLMLMLNSFLYLAKKKKKKNLYNLKGKLQICIILGTLDLRK